MARLRNMIRETKRVLLYLDRFGAVGGSTALFKVFSKSDHVPMPGFAVPVKVRAGTSDAFVFDDVFVFRDYDIAYENEEPELIIDGGANVGYVSLFFAHKFPRARILAVEPEPSNFESLVYNTRGCPNVTPIKAALWNKKTSLNLRGSQEDKWGFQVSEDASPNGQSVQAVSIPELMEIAGRKQIDILKLDIEGAEKELFESGYEAWLDKVGMIIVELHDWFRDGCSTSFYRATSQYKFKQHMTKENIVLVKY